MGAGKARTVPEEKRQLHTARDLEAEKVTPARQGATIRKEPYITVFKTLPVATGSVMVAKAVKPVILDMQLQPLKRDT